jgi:hypothetical protein
VTGPLADRLEYAVLEFVMGFSEQSHQDSWGEWQNHVHRTVSDPFQTAELKSAFKRLWFEGVLRLSKPDLHRRHAYDYSGKENDDDRFFYNGPFNATITDQGRRYWDRLKFRRRNGVFISHITEEKPVAHVLQKYLKLAFGDTFRVFVSSDAKSIGGGKKWYTHIIDNLRLSEVVLVLVSQESKAREWINFEAGFGEGSESLVIPVGVKNISLGQLSYPLAGIQGRSIDDIGAILEDIGNRIGATPANIDGMAYRNELEHAEAQLIYKSYSLEPVIATVGSYDGPYSQLRLAIQNNGNVDLELLMLQVYVPEFAESERAVISNEQKMGVHVSVTSRQDTAYRRYSCYSPRGAFEGKLPILPPIITTSMGQVTPSFAVTIKTGLSSAQREFPIFFQLHVIGYRTVEEECKIADIPGWR